MRSMTARRAESRGVTVRSAGAPRAAVTRMTAEVPNLEVHFDEATHNPVQVVVTGAVRARGLSKRAAPSPETAARQFVQDRADLWQLDDRDVGTVDVVSVSTTGLPTVKMLQKVDGVEVFQSDMTAALGADNNVVSVSGQLFHGAATGPQRAAARAAAPKAAGSGPAELTEEEAIAKAAFDLTGHQYKASDFRPAKKSARRDEGPYRSYDSKWKAERPAAKPARKNGKMAAPASVKAAPPRFERPVRVKDVLFPMGEGEFVPGYYIELWLEGYPAFSYVVDKIDAPDILFRKNLTSRVAFKYRVHNRGDALFRPEDGPAPGSPHPTGKPNGFQAATIPEKIDRDREPAAGAALAPAECDHHARQQLHRVRRPPRSRGAGGRRRRRQGHRRAHVRHQVRSHEIVDRRKEPAEPASWACSSTSIGCTTAGTRPDSTKPRATLSRTISDSAGLVAIRSWPTATTSAAPTTPTCRRRRMARARACRCSASTARTRCQAGPATTRR